MAKGDLKSQFGSFVRGALAQLDSVREVVVQKSKAGRIQLDVAMMRRRRKEILAEIGATVVRLAGNGRISETDFPELGPSLAQLEALDERIAVEEDHARRVAEGAGPGEDQPPHDDYYDEQDEEVHTSAEDGGAGADGGDPDDRDDRDDEEKLDSDNKRS